MPSFGIFKKLKDTFKKVKGWLKDSLPKARAIMNQAAPVIKDILQEPKFNNAIDIASDGIVAADDFLNGNEPRSGESINKKNYKDGVNWINKNIQPRLRQGFL